MNEPLPAAESPRTALGPSTGTAGRPSPLELLRLMLVIRRFEERCAQLYQQEEIRGFLHLYVGEEAIASGVISRLAADDAVVSTYREHGHALMKGVPMRAVMAEMFGRSTGCSRGRGGSMHLFSAEQRFFGGNAIVAGGLPIAVGLALADRYRKQERATVCFFGEGAVAEGVFHEAVNLAALWRLPVLFACENNRYAMGTAIERSHAVTDLAARAASYGVAAWRVDGMDVEQVAIATDRALELLSHEPVFIEFETYRLRAHSKYDPELYRSRHEVERWRERDPIVVLGDRLRACGDLDDGLLQRMEHEIDAMIDDAVEFARDSPFEALGTLHCDVYDGQRIDRTADRAR